jgi:hypothetical protein
MYEYPYIWAWQHLMGARPAYTEKQCRKARSSGQPKDVVYFNDETGQWVKLTQLKPIARALVEKKAKDEEYL